MMKTLVVTVIIISVVAIATSFIDRKYDYVVETPDKVLGYTFTPFPNENGCAVYYSQKGKMKGTICGNFFIEKRVYGGFKPQDYEGN